MNKIILIISFLICSSTNAGTAKISWSHDYKAVDGSAVTLTAFKIYWSINGGTFTNVIQLGPPAFLPWKSALGVYYYAKTLDVAAWVPGANICFKMTAIAGTMESAQSNQACKLMPSDPTQPIIIDIDHP